MGQTMIAHPFHFVLALGMFLVVASLTYLLVFLFLRLPFDRHGGHYLPDITVLCSTTFWIGVGFAAAGTVGLLVQLLRAR